MDYFSRNPVSSPRGNAPHPEPGVPLSPALRNRQAEANKIVQILQILWQGKHFLVCSHARPDGDAVGSMLAMGMFLAQLGKHADLVTADRVPGIHRNLPGVENIRTAQCVHGPYDAAILLECDGLERPRLPGLEEFFLINIDHHATGQPFGNVNWIDCQVACVGELVYRLVKAAKCKITPQMATCLYTTMLTDTGSFCYGYIHDSTFGLARELVRAGADPVRIAQDVYFSASTAKLLLLGAALNNLKREGRLAWLWVTHQDTVRTCASEEDCEGIVNFALAVSGVEVAVFLRELPNGHIRLSLRSKGQINVAAVARRLGGGGHESAAGCTLEGPLPRALNETLSQLRPSVALLAEKPAERAH